MCARCSSNSVAGWALYLFLVLFPVTVFYVLIIIFNIRATYNFHDDTNESIKIYGCVWL